MINLDNILNDFNLQFKNVANKAALDEIRVKFLGKKGVVTELFTNLRDVKAEDKKAFGATLNALRGEITNQIDIKKEFFDNEELNAKLSSQKLDITEPIRRNPQGFAHPISKVIKEIREIFDALGFDFSQGPEIEEDFFNFTALNMPQNHPARQMQDTFYLQDANEKLLRTHTSNVQIRKMMNSTPPLRSMALGKVFRRDSDQTHTPMFHQIEGFIVDETTNMAHLKWILEEFLRQFFGTNDISLRFRPSFFPFTEPSAEVDIGYKIENGRIKIGSHEKFMEILGCGMIHANVLKNCKIDAKKYQGFAFGIGIERLAMLKYGINDLRMFFENDLRFLQHFGFKNSEF
ncbi:MAG TPA: phenylalanine--tRNA ligase subunit alpha [Rickettsiales bacterium]|nr:phenylalanine--tRNA ligase subunit alpha [Rickettsiales bacterium]